jgi:hypothetical protein
VQPEVAPRCQRHPALAPVLGNVGEIGRHVAHCLDGETREAVFFAAHGFDVVADFHPVVGVPRLCRVLVRVVERLRHQIHQVDVDFAARRHEVRRVDGDLAAKTPRSPFDFLERRVDEKARRPFLDDGELRGGCRRRLRRGHRRRHALLGRLLLAR